mmetsp:Transcript_31807/g.28167  ORF Transcript_31807/g.28167 Transcript_31807/m.28167 type:complete len:95 (+) Transcript_31807:890-1174(+)
MVHFKNSFFTIYDSVQNTSKKYFSRRIEISMDGALESEDTEIELLDEKITTYSPKFLSVCNPRFVKNLKPDCKSRKSFISFSISDVSSVDIINK